MGIESEAMNEVVGQQLTGLDDSDALASAWSEALAAAGATGKVSWGGRGRGGRGLARRTVQPHDVIVERVSLEYVGSGAVTARGRPKTLLQESKLKLLSSRVYAIVGRNGCGKSTLLRRIAAGKVPGFPVHLSTLYVPQEVLGQSDSSPLQVVLRHRQHVVHKNEQLAKDLIRDLERQLDHLDVSTEEDQAETERICEEIALLEEQMEHGYTESRDEAILRSKAQDALRSFGITADVMDVPTDQLSGGQLKRVILASALFCNPDILMLDEPTNHLDIVGLFHLRHLIAKMKESRTITILVSHDVDLINDVATDVMHFANLQITYYQGNYGEFLRVKHQQTSHQIRQSNALEKQRTAMIKTIDNLHKQGVGKHGDKKKLAAADSRRKKLEKHGIQKNDKGHRWKMQDQGSGIKVGSINSLDASTRKKHTTKQLLKNDKTNVAPVPDKAVQFDFHKVLSTWGEPLIMAMEIGHGYNIPTEQNSLQTNTTQNDKGQLIIQKREGYLFDCVDLRIDEGTCTCILGANGSGKSTLLRILAGVEQPTEGKLQFSHGVNVAYYHQHIADELIDANEHVAHSINGKNGNTMVTALSLLRWMYPEKSEQDLRGELTSFGLSPEQACTNVKFLSGGERCRLCLAIMMLKNPHVLILDEPTNHLDVESVDALTYGIRKWNGTVVMVSHDANLIRSIGGVCYAIMEKEGTLARVPGGIDAYLRSFASESRLFNFR